MNRTVHIAGGGLAGLSLAIGLQRHGVPAVVHEAGNYPRHRVCGEFILGVSDTVLRDLGIDVALTDVQQHEDCAWHVGDRLATLRRLPMPARAISRHRLDLRLADLCRAMGGEVRTGDRVEPSQEAGWVHTAGRPRSEGRWLGLKAHFSDLPLVSGLEMHLGRGGYAGLTQVEDGRVNVCALLPSAGAPAAEKSDLLAARLEAVGLKALAARLRSASIDPASITGVTHFSLGWQRPMLGDGLCLGDNSSMIPPFTGAGMSMAFESAALALPEVQSWATGQVAWEDAARKVRERLATAFRRRLRWAAALHPLLLSSAGQRALNLGLRTGLVPFDFLVRILRT